MRHCPNCNCNMKNKSFYHSGIADWDMDYPALYHEEYVCTFCGVKYINGKWEIPDKYLATEKQQKTALFIESVMGIESPCPPTKSKVRLYISKYFEEAKQARFDQLESMNTLDELGLMLGVGDYDELY